MSDIREHLYFFFSLSPFRNFALLCIVSPTCCSALPCMHAFTCPSLPLLTHSLPVYFPVSYPLVSYPTLPCFPLTCATLLHLPVLLYYPALPFLTPPYPPTSCITSYTPSLPPPPPAAHHYRGYVCMHSVCNSWSTFLFRQINECGTWGRAS